MQFQKSKLLQNWRFFSWTNTYVVLIEAEYLRVITFTSLTPCAERIKIKALQILSRERVICVPSKSTYTDPYSNDCEGFPKAEGKINNDSYSRISLVGSFKN
ncbi:hypothetical protein NPIL_23991 [Nephila pilipes]|uniref:Uncharacterized protein n=1 Tax=Nephila pilipes TaxID=299642 RepID=A0A8X6M9X7_NEPPI|nr:hypothetical protein NPIL_23991 [Nephila pilipes]